MTRFSLLTRTLALEKKEKGDEVTLQRKEFELETSGEREWERKRCERGRSFGTLIFL